MIPEELEDIDLLEGIKLIQVQMSYVPKLLEALRKPAKTAV